MRQKLTLKDKLIVGLSIAAIPVTLLAGAIQHNNKVDDNRCKLRHKDSFSQTYVCDKTHDGIADTVWYHSLEKPSFETEASEEDINWYSRQR